MLHTALSDLEVLASEERGKLWRFRYPLSDGELYNLMIDAANELIV